MTTETRARPACLMDVCQKCRKPENWRETAIVHGDTEQSTNYRHRKDGWPALQSFQHEFVGHTHSVECSAKAFAAIFGCEAYATPTGIVWCATDGHEQFHPCDIIASPGTDEAWLAMRDVLEEVQRRGYWYFIEEGASEGCANAHVGKKGPDDGPIAITYDQPPPAAVALAAWAASLEEGAE